MCKNFSNFIKFLSLFLLVSSCTSSGRTHKKDYSIAKFITGTAMIDTVKDVHIVNMIRAIGAPNNSATVDKYKYYQWLHSRTVGVSTLFGGGSTTLYCNLTAETQANKIKLINWYGNQCSVFLDPIGEYFKDKLNIAVIMDEDEKKQNPVTVKTIAGESDLKEKSSEYDKPIIDLRQKSSEQKALEQTSVERPVDLKPTSSEKSNIVEVK
jgi:histidyl-tRNA synthetase